MLQSQKNRKTIGILEQLRRQGAPSVSPVPGGFDEEAPEDVGLDEMGQVLQSPAISLPGMTSERKKRRKPLPTSEY